MSPGLAICPLRDKIIPVSKPLTSKSRCSLNTTAAVLCGPHTRWSNADTDAVFRCQRVIDMIEPEPWLLVGHFNRLCEQRRGGKGPLVSSCRVGSEELHPCYNATLSSMSGGVSSMTAHIVHAEGGRSQRLRPLS